MTKPESNREPFANLNTESLAGRVNRPGTATTALLG